ncbi:methyl-accepting chemotaxis protein, partial [Xanthomonas translucens]
TMTEIVSSVQRVTDIMSEIAAASQEQSSGIEQVNQTVTQMDETTQQNAALVEEATAAARSMEEQAGQLTEAVSIFRVEQTPASAPPPPPRHAQVHSIRTVATKPAAVPSSKPALATRSNKSVPALADSDWQEF